MDGIKYPAKLDPVGTLLGGGRACLEFGASTGNTFCWSFPSWIFRTMGMERSPFPTYASQHIQATYGQRRLLDNVCQRLELCRASLLHPYLLPAHVRIWPSQGWNSISASRLDAK